MAQRHSSLPAARRGSHEEAAPCRGCASEDRCEKCGSGGVSSSWLVERAGGVLVIDFLKKTLETPTKVNIGGLFFL